MVSEQDMHPLALRYGNYILFMERWSAQVRHLPNFMDLYDKATAEWLEQGPRRPALGDEIARKKFYEETDKICFREHEGSTPEQCIIAVHAAGAGALTVLEHELASLPAYKRLRLARQGNDYAVERLMPDPAIANLMGASTSFRIEYIPPGHQDAIKNEESSSEATPLDEIIDNLFNKPIRYRGTNGAIRECTIVDYGTSRRYAGGKYYLVVYGEDEEEIMYTESDMVSILERRVE
ncbi:hypothetical protein EST38_g13294 [Candolleomyces aberdarensis]|uniref:Uncharacterized protein n=1 Tax=Candolleomyces aberdarensis TaxID=2316362 RepID=A0A4Q2D1E1_9AGAR|nr:hypothetical protein EST38_g13294 [Candolleomyces aberdarensis]